MLKKGVGRNSLNVYLSFDRFLGEYFLFYGLAKFYLYIALAWRHRSFLSKILFRFFTRSLGMRLAPSVHDDISLSKLIFFTHISADRRRCHFRLRVLANHFASIFLLSLSGDSFGLLSLSPGHKMQTSVGFHSDLDLLVRPRGIDLDSYSSLNGHSLGGLLIRTRRGRGHSLSLSSQW